MNANTVITKRLNGVFSLRAARSWALGLVLLCPIIVAGQGFTLDWSTIDGGGGTSTGGVYSVTGTIGQPDASGPLTGGNYSLTGGFWSLIAAVQTAGLPNLSVAHSGNSVIVSWPNTASCTVQTNSNLATPSGWNAYGGTVNTANGTNSITITPPTGNLFFRLSNP